MTELHLELATPAESLSPVSPLGATACRASLLLRKDVQRHLLMARDELGFHAVRVYGLLADDMGFAQPDGSFDFTKVERALDMLLENGLVPFVELTGLTRMLMPEGGGDGWRVGPPKDWGKWEELVRAFAQALDGRYGCDVEMWHFEVGHEPDVLWTGTQDEFFRLYDLAAAAIKGVHASYRVGGPGTSNPEWLGAFTQHLMKPPEQEQSYSGRCDFISARSGPADSMASVREKVTAALGADIPVIYIAGSGGAAAGSASDDECGRAAAVCRMMADVGVAVAGISPGMMYQNLSDISDERGWQYEPFHGGRGLVTVNDIRKSAFHAFRLLHQHVGYHSSRLRVHWTEPLEGLGCIATRNEDTLRLLLWYHRPPDASAAAPARTAKFTIEGLPESVRRGQVEVIRPEAGSAYETWVESGRPTFVNRDVLDALESASHPASAEVDFRQYPPRLEPGMVMQLLINLPWEENRAY